MLTLALTTLALAQLPTVHDFIDNAEIGDAQQWIALRSHGAYESQIVDKAKGNTTVSGKWQLKGDDTIEVTAVNCKGPACKDAKKNYTAKIGVAAARAMTVDSAAPKPFFPSGSYYCHYLGCEPRTGVEILSKAANLKAMHAVEDHLISRNVGRNSTVVWIGARTDTDTTKSRIEVCGRDPERSKKGLEELKADLSASDWFGEVTVVEKPAENCLWDVRLYVRDDVQPPVKRKR